MTLLPSQAEGIRALRAEAYRVAALIEMELSGLDCPAEQLPKGALCAMGVAMQGPVNTDDIRGVIDWAQKERNAGTVTAEQAFLLFGLISDAKRLERWIEGKL